MFSTLFVNEFILNKQHKNMKIWPFLQIKLIYSENTGVEHAIIKKYIIYCRPKERSHCLYRLFWRIFGLCMMQFMSKSMILKFNQSVSCCTY